jgi:hypothetical protein
MSSAVKACRFMLAQNAALTAVVPDQDGRIAIGRLKEGTLLPALVVSHISTVRRSTIKAEAIQFCTSRVQVTVHAKSYPEQDGLQKLVRAALPPTRGAVNGVDLDDIQPGGDGPDLIDDHWIGTTDFIVTFNE